MITFVEGNLLKSRADALVNTVNEVGVMGKGIALMFSEAFPLNKREYEDACRDHKVQVGRMFVTPTESLIGPKWIINFPTKKHWRNPSKLEWIRDGLEDLARVVTDLKIESVAVPPLGCGNGGLDWSIVEPLITEKLGSLEGTKVVVYRPTARYQNSPKAAPAPKLTPAKALIVELMRRYSVLGFECSLLEVQKMAWFVSRAILRLKLKDPFKLKFEPRQYGPYADSLRHLLNSLDGSYLKSGKRISDAVPSDVLEVNADLQGVVDSFLRGSEMRPYEEAIEWTQRIVDGFESPFGMELLATVDWLVFEKRIAPDVQSVRDAIASWPHSQNAAARKIELFDDRVVGIAIKRLLSVQSSDKRQQTLMLS